MTRIVWQLLKMSKYPYDNKSLYNLLTKVNLFFSLLFSSFREISFKSLTREGNPQDTAAAYSNSEL